MSTSLTFISDTHGRHQRITNLLPGGDILIHTGDISNQGYEQEVRDFLKWFEKLPYARKIFIAGNHDRGFEESPEDFRNIINEYDVEYLQDSSTKIGELNVYGSPWQPRFHDWAFNIDRNSEKMEAVWNNIPQETDILLTHGPAWGHLDKVIGSEVSLGCELLGKHITHRVLPLIHACGHIHTGRGLYSNGQTTFINSAILNERYEVAFKPIILEIDNSFNITLIDN